MPCCCQATLPGRRNKTLKPLKGSMSWSFGHRYILCPVSLYQANQATCSLPLSADGCDQGTECIDKVTNDQLQFQSLFLMYMYQKSNQIYFPGGQLPPHLSTSLPSRPHGLPWEEPHAGWGDLRVRGGLCCPPRPQCYPELPCSLSYDLCARGAPLSFGCG